MSRLFLIGNGYDMARDRNTSYYDFKTWLQDYGKSNRYFTQYYNDGQLDFSKLNQVPVYGSEIFQSFGLSKTDIIEIDKQRMAAAAAILLRLMQIDGDKWGSFEEELGTLQVKSLYEEWDKYNKGHNINLSPSVGSPVSRITDITTSISKEIILLFSDWAKSLESKCGIGPSDKKPFENRIIKKLKRNDTLIVFNYTSTIEDMFPDSQSTICHIHGCIKAKDEEIVVGHNSKDMRSEGALCDETDYENMLRGLLRKDSHLIIKNHQDIWDKIKGEKKLVIIEFGLSCSSPDEPYIEKIINVLGNTKNSKLWINNHGNHGKKKEQVWRKAGYKGKFIYYVEDDKNILVKKRRKGKKVVLKV